MFRDERKHRLRTLKRVETRERVSPVISNTPLSSFLYLKCPFYIYIVTTALPELRLYRRGVILRNPTAGASIGEPCALAYTLRTAYISYA